MDDFLEKTLEDIVIENSDKIHSRGFVKLHDNNERQFYLPSGKKIDILSWEIDSLNDHIYVKVIELKRFKIDVNALSQAVSYCSEIRWMMNQMFGNITIELVLCGNSICDIIPDFLHLTTCVSVYTYKYDFEGIHFDKVLPTDFKLEMKTDSLNRYKSFLFNIEPIENEEQKLNEVALKN